MFARPRRKTYLFCVLQKTGPWTVSRNEGRGLSCQKERSNETRGCWLCEGRLILANALRCCLQKINRFLSTTSCPFLASPEIYLNFASHISGVWYQIKTGWLMLIWNLYKAGRVHTFSIWFFYRKKILNLALFIYWWNPEVYLFMFVSSLKRKEEWREREKLIAVAVWVSLNCSKMEQNDLFQKTKMIMSLNSLGKLGWLGIRENDLIRKRNQEIALI